MGDRYQILRNAFRDFRKNDGVLCVDTEMQLRAVGFDPEQITEEFTFGETPMSIIENEESHGC